MTTAEQSCDGPKSSGTRSPSRRGDGAHSHHPVIPFHYQLCATFSGVRIPFPRDRPACVSQLLIWDCTCRSPPIQHAARSKGGRKLADIPDWGCLLGKSANLSISELCSIQYLRPSPPIITIFQHQSQFVFAMASVNAQTTSSPSLKDLTIENITENVNLVNSSNPSPRFKFLLERLVNHLHDYARETHLSQDEWHEAISFLTATGQKCTEVRQEFVLLSDILGLSLLVDSIDHPKPTGSTEGTILGPFHTHDAEHLDHGATMSHDEKGEPLLVVCSVKDMQGNPISGVKIDVWETDSTGMYDVQHAGRDRPEGRCILTSNDDGKFWFRGIVPVPYPIPHDGPVGRLLSILKRHPMRPSHMHFMFDKPGWDKLTTALYLRGDPYETSDAVFGVKESLVVDLGLVDEAMVRLFPGCFVGMKLLTYDFVLVTEQETKRLRDVNNQRLTD